jgi:hypothetical protein
VLVVQPGEKNERDSETAKAQKGSRQHENKSDGALLEEAA